VGGDRVTAQDAPRQRRVEAQAQAIPEDRLVQGGVPVGEGEARGVLDGVAHGEVVEEGPGRGGGRLHRRPW
jgi:hypothetical protein